MKIQNVPFTVTDWSRLDPEKHKGDPGMSYWRVFTAGNIRARLVEYEPGYRQDHWCGRGHVLLVLEGEINVELQDGQKFSLAKGMSFQAADDEANPHLIFTDKGAKVFIVD
jgi:quercetin dioxygenase-like cupin family protein